MALECSLCGYWFGESGLAFDNELKIHKDLIHDGEDFELIEKRVLPLGVTHLEQQ